jgi:hypothetical protein
MTSFIAAVVGVSAARTASAPTCLRRPCELRTAAATGSEQLGALDPFDEFMLDIMRI